MGSFELVTAVCETRVFLCKAPYYHFETKDVGVCNNLMKIIVISVDGFDEQLEAVNESPSRHNFTINGTTFPLFSENGACLSSKLVDYTTNYRRYKYGPVKAETIKFVHCKRCLVAHSWRKFKKLDL